MSYYTPTGAPIAQGRGVSQSIRSEFAAIAAGFALLPVASAISGGYTNYAVDAGTSANTYIITLSSSITSYVDGLSVVFRASNTNTGASTINVNGLGSIAIKRTDGTALQANDILANQIVGLTYSVPQSAFQLTTGSSVALSASSSASASAQSAAASASSAASSAAAAAAGISSFRNSIINGNMAVAQRGTSFSLTNSYAYTLDRWAAAVVSGTAAATVSQVPLGSSGFQYAAKIQRTSGSSNTNAIVFAQALETINSVPLAGKTVTVSFYAKAGGNFSAAGSNLSLALVSGTGTDQSVQGVFGGGWTGCTYPINTTTAISATLQKYSFSTTIPANATQIGFCAWMVSPLSRLMTSAIW